MLSPFNKRELTAPTVQTDQRDHHKSVGFGTLCSTQIELNGMGQQKNRTDAALLSLEKKATAAAVSLAKYNDHFNDTVESLEA
jgi:hypothetical protein